MSKLQRGDWDELVQSLRQRERAGVPQRYQVCEFPSSALSHVLVTTGNRRGGKSSSTIAGMKVLSLQSCCYSFLSYQEKGTHYASADAIIALSALDIGRWLQALWTVM